MVFTNSLRWLTLGYEECMDQIFVGKWLGYVLPAEPKTKWEPNLKIKFMELNLSVQEMNLSDSLSRTIIRPYFIGVEILPPLRSFYVVFTA